MNVPQLYSYDSLKSFITSIKCKIDNVLVGIGSYYTKTNTYFVSFEYDSKVVNTKVIGGEIGTEEYFELFEPASVNTYLSNFYTNFYQLLCDNYNNSGIYWLNKNSNCEEIYTKNVIELLLDDIFDGLENFLPKPSLYINNNMPIYTTDSIESKEDTPITVTINNSNQITSSKRIKVENYYSNFDNDVIKLKLNDDNYYLKVDYINGSKYVRKLVENINDENIFCDLLRFVTTQNGKNNFDIDEILMDSIDVKYLTTTEDDETRLPTDIVTYATYFLYQFNEVITYLLKNDIDSAKNKFVSMFFDTKGRPNVYNILNNNIFILTKYIEENLNKSDHQEIGVEVDLSNTGYDNCGVIWDSYYRSSFNDLVENDTSVTTTGDNYKTNLIAIGPDKTISLNSTINVDYYIPTNVPYISDYQNQVNSQLEDTYYEPTLLKNILTDNIDNYINTPVTINYYAYQQVDDTIIGSIDKAISEEFMRLVNNESKSIMLRCYNPISKNQWSNSCNNSYCKCEGSTCELDFLNMLYDNDSDSVGNTCATNASMIFEVGTDDLTVLHRLLRRTFGYDPITRYNNISTITQCNTTWDDSSDNIFKTTTKDEFDRLRTRMTDMFNLKSDTIKISELNVYKIMVEFNDKLNIMVNDATCFAYKLTIYNTNSDSTSDNSEIFRPYISYEGSAQIWTKGESSCKSIYGKELFVTFDSFYNIVYSDSSKLPFHIQNDNEYHIVLYDDNSSKFNMVRDDSTYKQSDLLTSENISKYLPYDLITGYSKYFIISNPDDRNKRYINVTNEYYSYAYNLLKAYGYNIMSELVDLINEKYTYFYMINKMVTYSGSVELWDKHFGSEGTFINIPLGRTAIFIENGLIMNETKYENNMMYDKIYEQIQTFRTGLKFGPHVVIFVPYINDANSLYYLTVGDYVDTGINVELYNTESSSTTTSLSTPLSTPLSTSLSSIGKTIYDNVLSDTSKVGLVIYCSQGQAGIDPDSTNIMNAYFGNYDTSVIRSMIGKSTKVNLKFISLQNNECEIDTIGNSIYTYYMMPVNINSSFNTTKNKNMYFKTAHKTELLIK